MPGVGFGPTTPAFEQAKTTHALSHVVIVLLDFAYTGVEYDKY
jgi:hypothetical protein